MEGDVNSLPRLCRVVSIEIQERIKCCSRIRIQKCFPQSGLAGFADGQVLPLVPGITKTQLPVPSLEIIAKFSHLTTQPHVKQRIPVGELFVSRTGVVNSAKSHPGRHWDTDSVNNHSVIGHRERIKRIRDWHTYAGRTKAYVSAWVLEWIRRKRHRRQRRIEK